MNHAAVNHWVVPGKPKLQQHVRVAGRARIHEGMTLPGGSLTDLGGKGPGWRGCEEWAKPNLSQTGGRHSGSPLGCGWFG